MSRRQSGMKECWPWFLGWGDAALAGRLRISYTMVNPCQHMRWTRLRLMPRCVAIRCWVQPWRRRRRMRCCCVCVTHSRMTIGMVSKTAAHTKMQVMIQVVMIGLLALHQLGLVWVTRSFDCSRGRLLVATAGVLPSAPCNHYTP